MRAAAASSQTSTLQGFDEAQAGFTPAMKQLVDAVEEAFRNAVERLGRVNILVNNAGVNGKIANTWEYPVKEWERVLAIEGVFYCCRSAIPHMIDCSWTAERIPVAAGPARTIVLSGSGLIPRHAIEEKLRQHQKWASAQASLNSRNYAPRRRHV
ncbi:SDR family NAD(P)-dependent oxidoreductase [Sinorhizobium medicae]|nr:SDR family NAD(P)-dependent oxidoreductase [Sinorhizobium medicae]